MSFVRYNDQPVVSAVQQKGIKFTNKMSVRFSESTFFTPYNSQSIFCTTKITETFIVQNLVIFKSVLLNFFYKGHRFRVTVELA